jgi:aryl-alcohol dehydrogenase-like predicted oxidoreductase
MNNNLLEYWIDLLQTVFNFIDTADVYSNWAPGNKGGESETVIGNWMKSRGNRNKLVIATKVGWILAVSQVTLDREDIEHITSRSAY